MKAKVAKIASHGITCFVNRQLIYNYPESLLAEAGIMSIEHADFEGVERLALVTGGEIASTFDQPELVKIGRCDVIEEIMIGEDKVRVAARHARTRSGGRRVGVELDGITPVPRFPSSSSFPVWLPVKRAPSSSAAPPPRWSTRPNDRYTTRFPSSRRPSRRLEWSSAADALRC
jgi:hypothetical protein